MSEIQEALNKIQSKLVAPKNQFNSFGKYKYRSCEDILEGLKPLLKETGAVLVIADNIKQLGDRYYVEATAAIFIGNDKVSVKAYARESLNKKGMDDSQVTGAASSYARKYALNGLFCIDDTKDADTVEKQENVKPEANPQGKQGNSQPSAKVISEKQGKRLLAIAKEKGYSRDIVKEWVQANYGFEHLRDITLEKYDEIVEYYQTPEEDQGEGWNE